MEDLFDWIAPYQAIATALCDYHEKQDVLTTIVNDVLGEQYEAMDPLTFFSMFNGKLQKFERREQAVAHVIESLGLDVIAPKDYNGLPVTNAQRWRFWGSGQNYIENNWQVFLAAIAYADHPSAEAKAEFIRTFDIVRAQKNVGDANLTMALYWARPNAFLPLDRNSKQYLRNRYNLTYSSPIAGEAYLDLIEKISAIDKAPFPTISFRAWELGGWIPAPNEYDPGISSDTWTSILENPQLTTKNALTTLACLLDSKDGATCLELSERYGRSDNFYNSNISSLGERISKTLSIPPREFEGAGKYWPIPCVGNYVSKKRHGVFEWRLRPELIEALEAMDLSGINLIQKGRVLPEPTSFSREKLELLIRRYKSDFFKFRGSEIPEGDHEAYKWSDALAYQQNWDLEAEDFADRVVAALKPSATGQGALLGNGFEYPYARIAKLVAYDQDSVREAFRLLYDPDAELEDAYNAFTEAMEIALASYNESHEKQLSGIHQKPSAVSVYLAFECPRRFHIFKPRIAESFVDFIGASLHAGSLDKFLSYESLCEEIMPYVLNDEELVQLSDSVLTPEQIAADPGHHLLLQDITYYCARYMSTWHPEGEELEMPPTITEPTYPKNSILYGPPGTGKTYRTRAYAVAICDGRDLDEVLVQMGEGPESEQAVVERYHQLEKENRIKFVTFHQSYSYEDFIEGMRPDFDDASGMMTYPVRKGTFLDFCEKADSVVETAAKRRGIPRFEDNPTPTVWKIGLSVTEIPDLYNVCRKEGSVRVGWSEVRPEDVVESPELSDANKKALIAFQDEMQPGDFAVIPAGDKDNYAIAVITGDFEWQEGFRHASRYRSARWIGNISKADFRKINDGKSLTLQTVYELKRISAAQLLEAAGLVEEEAEAQPRAAKPYVFIIDEINRGNVSKVLGELITLLEEDKRKGEPGQLEVELPYSHKQFSVPSNVYVIGTMNTADRSIARIDTALRRRFTFIEVMPDPNLLEGLEIEGIDMAKMLETMNARIEVLLDRDHELGHALFLKLRENPTIDNLASVFDGAVIPLLQEYFFDDYGKIRSVLGAAADAFVKPKNARDVFWAGDEGMYDHLTSYTLKPAPKDPAVYEKIYQTALEA